MTIKNFDKISVFQAVTSGYTKSYQSEKLLKTVNNTTYTTFHFLSVFNGSTSILSARNHFCEIFLNSHKYFQEVFLRRISDVTE